MENTQLNNNVILARLYDATIEGDLTSLHSLLQQDPLILDRCIFEKSDRFMQSPLHIAANLGHLEFTTVILRLKPELAEQLDQLTRSSALHLASKKGHEDVVKKLIEVNPTTCLARDEDGRNPIHIAAISNQLRVLRKLVRVNPNAARQRTNNGETVLHLCVNYAQFDSLKYLVDAMGDLLNAKDKDGNTVLHLAVLANQLEATKLLVKNKKMQQNAINKNGLTAIDCLFQGDKNLIDTEIHRSLKRAKVLKAKQVEKQRDKDEKWLKKQRNTLMVVASLIAGMAFQFGVGLSSNSGKTHWTVIMANTISLASSLSVVLLLISGLPCRRLFVIVLMLSMWVAVTATVFTYVTSVLGFVSAKSNDYNSKFDIVFVTPILVAFSWVILVLVLVFGHILRFLIKLVKKLVQLMKKMWRKEDLNSAPLPHFVTDTSHGGA